MSFKRCIVLVDGLQELPYHGNPSNIDRIRHVTKFGKCLSSEGSIVLQNVLYYTAADTSQSIFRQRKDSPLYQQVRNITKNIVDSIDSQQHEVFLFGSGDGAFVVRAVAGILHHMGLLKPEVRNQFEIIYEQTEELIKARHKDDDATSKKLTEFLKLQSNGSIKIAFMGLFHATGTHIDSPFYETRLVSSIKHYRHASGCNETNKAHKVHIAAIAPTKQSDETSQIHAWFFGTFADLCGGIQHDGLGLYALQWMLLEAAAQGLLVGHEEDSAIENPMQLVFPNNTNESSSTDTSNVGPWEITYLNGIVVTMYNLDSIHVEQDDPKKSSHTMPPPPKSLYDLSDGVMDKQSRNGRLIGWDPSYPQGFILHPSMFSILQRYPLAVGKPPKNGKPSPISEFSNNYMRTGTGQSKPWLEDWQPDDNRVKAFRILVCGKTGVGKSTLINKIFGVELTEESDSYSQGVHNIDEAFESPNHPGLLIHDSRGWQAGSDTELDLIGKFLQNRAFQKDAADALHMIWFCIDSDVSRIEEADRRTFATIAKHSNNVPVFVIGTKKDKLIAYNKIRLLDKLMEAGNSYPEAKRLASEEADKQATEQFLQLKTELSQLPDYKADGFVCLSKDDEPGVKTLLQQSLNTIVDEQVRMFCVAAQVVDVDSKIESAITECMRLGKHAIRTAMVPLPLSGTIGTPTVSRLICEHTLQCFGFPKAVPEEVERIMKTIVSANMKQYLAVTLTQALTVGIAATAIGVFTMGAGFSLMAANCFMSTPPVARTLLKCSCDMILILERSFRYNGRYVSTTQIEDAARQFVTINIVTEAGKEKRLQDHIHDQIDKMIPLKRIGLGINSGFQKLRDKFEKIVYDNRFDLSPDYSERDPLATDVAELDVPETTVAELPGDQQLAKELSVESNCRAELPADSVQQYHELSGDTLPAELDGNSNTLPSISELHSSEVITSPVSSTLEPQSSTWGSAPPAMSSDVSRSNTTSSGSTASPALTTSRTQPERKSSSLLKRGFQSFRSKTMSVSSKSSG